MTVNYFGIYGASGFGREVMPLAREMLRGKPGFEAHELVFIDDNLTNHILNGHRVLTYEQFLGLSNASKRISIAISDSKVRKKISDRCEADSIELFNITANNAMILDSNEIGPGSIFCGFSTLTSNSKVGRCFQANIYSYIAHDCVVGDFVTLAPGCKVNGNVVLEDESYIGTGAIIKQGIPGHPLVIGKGAIVGMGAVVTKSVRPGLTVVGNPARPM